MYLYLHICFAQKALKALPAAESLSREKAQHCQHRQLEAPV